LNELGVPIALEQCGLDAPSSENEMNSLAKQLGSCSKTLDELAIGINGLMRPLLTEEVRLLRAKLSTAVKTTKDELKSLRSGRASLTILPFTAPVKQSPSSAVPSIKS
jgi:hypothetical protein